MIWHAIARKRELVVAGLDGIDPARIAVHGISQGGYWVARAAAFEHRYSAAITDPGVVDVSASWTSQLPKSLTMLLDEGKDEKLDSPEDRRGPAVRRTRGECQAGGPRRTLRSGSPPTLRS